MKYKRVILCFSLLFALLSVSSCTPFSLDTNIITPVSKEQAKEYATKANSFYYAGRSRSIKRKINYNFTGLNSSLYTDYKINIDYLTSETIYENGGITPCLAKKEISVEYLASDNTKKDDHLITNIHRWKNDSYYIEEEDIINGVKKDKTTYKIIGEVNDKFIEVNYVFGLRLPLEYFDKNLEMQAGFNALNELIIIGKHEETLTKTIDFIDKELKVKEETSYVYKLSFDSHHISQNKYDAFDYCEINKKIYALEDCNGNELAPTLINEQTINVACIYGVLFDYDLNKFPNISPSEYKEASYEDFI